MGWLERKSFRYIGNLLITTEGLEDYGDSFLFILRWLAAALHMLRRTKS
jgi:hypothetical protein